MKPSRIVNIKHGRLLLADLDRAAEGGGIVADLCADAAARIRKQDERIVMLKKMLSKWRARANRSSQP